MDNNILDHTHLDAATALLKLKLVESGLEATVDDPRGEQARKDLYECLRIIQEAQELVGIVEKKLRQLHE